VFLPDLASYSAAWASGQVDYGSAGSDQTRRQVLDTLNLRPDAVIAITTPPPSAQPLIVINSNTPPFDDERVRRAMSMAVDRTALLEGVAGGLASPGYGQDWNYFDRPLGSQPWTVEELGQYYQYNPDEAVKMLQAAGFEKGVGRQVELGFSTNTEGARNATYLAMSDFLQQIGIEVNLVTAADATAYSAKLYGADYKDLHVAIPRPAWDPDGFTYEQLHSQSTANFYNVNDPTLDDLCEQQQQLFDVDERRAVLTQIMERDLDQAYRLWGVNYYKIMMRDPKLFNAADHYLAWMTPGWGELKYELGWKQA
jgi:ABC-type transport system substrate-binding protein